MADEKWIEGLRGDTPAHEAAQAVLVLRLGAVRNRLPDAVFHAGEDIEHIHQLRVNTRRAAAALRLFADCLPPRLCKKTRRALRAIRRSAGEARDWDVFLQDLQPRRGKTAEAQRRGLDFLLGFGHGQRVLAQDHLRQAHADEGEAFSTHIQEVKDALEKDQSSEQTLSELAIPKLTQLLRELETAARADLLRYEALHQVRILGKQLRYAMEVFATCFAMEFREHFYPAVVEMQDILGLANDSFTASQRLIALRTRLMRTQPKQWPHYQAGVETLLHFHEKRLPMQRTKFERWWRDWLKSGAEQAFAALIQGT